MNDEENVDWLNDDEEFIQKWILDSKGEMDQLLKNIHDLMIKVYTQKHGEDPYAWLERSWNMPAYDKKSS